MESLLKNLDMTYYDSLTKEEKEKLNIIIENNIPLKTLLNNYLNKTRLDIKYIVGPESIRLLKKDDKQILLIGEHHVEYKDDIVPEKGIRIDAFLLHLFKNSSVPLDFYLETGTKSYKGQESMNRDYDIYRLRRTLEKSILNHKSYPDEYPTTRFHFIDVRLIPTDCLFSLPNDFYEGVDILPILKNINIDCKIFLKIKRNLKIINDPCIKKQVKKVISMYESFFNDDIRDFKQKYDSILFPISYQLEYEFTFFENIINCLERKEYDDDFLKRLKQYIFDISNLFMEAYTLQRMFRSFRQFENNISIEPRNIIFYGGAQHADIFYEQLINCGFKKEFRLKFKKINGKYPYISYVENNTIINYCIKNIYFI